jgi:hypothetical protein
MRDASTMDVEETKREVLQSESHVPIISPARSDSNLRLNIQNPPLMTASKAKSSSQSSESYDYHMGSE